MRYWPLLIILLLASGPLRAQTPDSLNTAGRLAQAGAAELALARVVHDQPGDPAAARWAQWEQLRLSLLSRLKHYQDLLARVRDLPSDAPPELRRTAFRLAADAALKLRRGELARHYLRRLLWRFDLDDKSYRRARDEVLESYLAQGRATDAYYVLLRLQQDFGTPDRELLAPAIELLLADGMAAQAGTWLPDLDDSDPLKLLLRLEAGLVPPAEALAAARTALQGGGAPLDWEVIRQVGILQHDPGLEVEGQEQLLNIPPDKGDPFDAVTAKMLWKAYLQQAQALGNRLQLLVGDDASWYQQALQVLPSNPSGGRALLAYLSLHTASAPLRSQAQAALVASLDGQRLGRTALRLFKDGSAVAGEPAPAVRRALGDIAFQQQDFSYAAALWAGLQDSRPDMAPQQWHFVRACAFLEGGSLSQAKAALNVLFSDGQELPQLMTGQLIALAGKLQERGRDARALVLLQGLLGAVDGAQRRQVLTALGRSAEKAGQYLPAADYYLQAATLPGGGATQPELMRTYLAAVENLRRAGLEADAKAVLGKMRLAKKLSGETASAGEETK